MPPATWLSAWGLYVLSPLAISSNLASLLPGQELLEFSGSIPPAPSDTLLLKLQQQGRKNSSKSLSAEDLEIVWAEGTVLDMQALGPVQLGSAPACLYQLPSPGQLSQHVRTLDFSMKEA